MRRIVSKCINSFPYLYARHIYHKKTGKCLRYLRPKDFSQKLFWLNRYWQDKRVVIFSDKVKVRDYIIEKGFQDILTQHYGVYSSAEDIDFSALPEQFVLKTNNSGAGWFISICKDKKKYDLDAARYLMACGLKDIPGVAVTDYQYQYIEPKIIAEEYLPNDNDNPRYEIQFFCFNGKAKHILVRTDLGETSDSAFAISYDLDWNRVNDRISEDMSIDIQRPKDLDKMIDIANKLAEPFPHVRVDLYYYYNTGRILFGELTFTTSGKVLLNYPGNTLQEWGRELKLPKRLPTRWKNDFPKWTSFRESIVLPKYVETVWNINSDLK